MASSSVKAPAGLQFPLSPFRSERICQNFPSNLILLRRPPFHCPLILTLARRRSRDPTSTSPSSSSKQNKKKLSRNEVSDEEEDEEDIDGEDAFEALFAQLEEDLKNDDLSFDDDEEISEEDVARLERELAEALGGDDMEFDSDTGEEKEDDKDNDKDEDEIMPVKLKSWQLRRLASALKIGRRKTSIKSLAAELCLDRAVVLDLLREPPPKLLMLSATLPDEPKPIVTVPEPKPIEALLEETKEDTPAAANGVKVPVHIMQGDWTARKRLKKVQVETLEKVYRRSKRPTNTMISSIVQVTNLPRKKVVKWFEEKRAEDGIQDHHSHLPYHRSVSETV